MSHFTVAAILPKGVKPKDVGSALERALAPFDENRDAPPYQEPCTCKEYTGAGLQRIEAVRGAVAELRRETPDFVPPSGASGDIFFQTNWTNVDHDAYSDFERDWQQKVDAITEEVNQRFPDLTPNPDCSDCHGTGTRTSTYNPLSKWDWWEIGGRWEGAWGSTDRLSAEKLLETLNGDDTPYPYALLEPVHDDDEIPDELAAQRWHQKGNMGWFGIDRNIKKSETWHDEVRRVLAQYPKSDVVLLDLHI